MNRMEGAVFDRVADWAAELEVVGVGRQNVADFGECFVCLLDDFEGDDEMRGDQSRFGVRQSK
jgi:hypothetical protein